MRLVYLFGNGFDLHVGLKTGYPDFLKYYLQQAEPANLDEVGKRYIRRLKEDIKGNIELWSDLELQFGKHTARFGTMGKEVHTLQEELDIVNDDIRDHLSKYIRQEDNRVLFPDSAHDAFIKDLVNPERHLRDFEIDNILAKRRNVWVRTANQIDIVTFNYTHTIERLLASTPVQAHNFTINEPIHVHGYHDNRMIFGVNDTSQIENKDLRKLIFATDALVKSDCNHTYGDGHTNACANVISQAQLLCCYGLSLGDTDKLWWNRICDTLRRNVDMIVILYLFMKDNINYSNNGHKLQQKRREFAEKLLVQGGIAESERNMLSARIYVSINDPIFNIHINERTDE